MAGGAETPRTREVDLDSNESREIVRQSQSRKKIYPELTTENFDEYKYKKLIDPIRANSAEADKIQKEFLGNMEAVEKELKNVGIKEFSYAKAKEIANANTTSPADKGLFRMLESQMTIVSTAQTSPIGNPNLEKLFSAKDQSEFDSQMADPNIVQKAYSDDADFKSRAQKVFDYIQNYRAKNTGTLEKDTVDKYLEEIFSASKEEFDTKMRNSSIIKWESLNDHQRASVVTAYHKYHLYRDKLGDELKLENTMKKERETFLSKPIEYAQSGEKYVADKIQTIRDHWAGMDGKEKAIAGLTMLIGTAWFLNSESEGIQKTRDALVKAGLLAVGYVGINTTSKAFAGKSLSQMGGNWAEDRSGKRDFLKDSFNANKEEADKIQTSLAVLGNHDFVELADNYLTEKARGDTYNIPKNLRGVSVGGVAESEMSPYNMYLVMELLDKKLKTKNSSIEKLKSELEKAQSEAKAEGKGFVPPTWLMIMTAVLKGQDLGFSFDKADRIVSASTKPVETVWETNNKDRTKMWWPLTGRPKDWQEQLVDKKPKETVNVEQLNKLSSIVLPESKPLSDIITDKNFGRFTRGFENLYKNAYKDNQGSGQIQTFEATDEKAMYVTSKIKVDNQAHANTAAARLASVEGAYELAVTELKKEPRFKDYQDRMSEFVHPVFGTFIGPNKEGAKEYVMFLRLTLPGSAEFDLRNNREWPEGNMMQQMHEKQLTTGDILTRADFKVMADRSVPDYYKKMGFPQIKALESAFGGAYESFLAKVRLSKDQGSEIDKVLKYYSQKFYNSGMTRAGLVRYLATHEFTEEEIKVARGLDASAELPNSGTDVYDLIKKASPDARIMTTLGNIVVLACNGDKTALARIKAYNPATVGEIKRNIAKAINPNNWTPKFINAVTQTDWDKTLEKIKIEDEDFVKKIETFINTNPKTNAVTFDLLAAYTTKVANIYATDSLEAEARKVVIAAMLQDYTQL